MNTDRWIQSLVRQAVRHSTLERKVQDSNLRPVKSDRVLPTARHHNDNTSKEAVLAEDAMPRRLASLTPRHGITLRQEAAKLLKDLLVIESRGHCVVVRVGHKLALMRVDVKVYERYVFTVLFNWV